MIVGYPASGKSTLASKLDGALLSRDKEGGTIEDLLPKFRALLQNGKKDVILDNTHLTRAIRKTFIDACIEFGVEIEAWYLRNTIEDSQIKLLHRMYMKYGEMYMTGKSSVADPGVFPPAVLFRARRDFEPPIIDEGFSRICTIDVEPLKFDRRRYRERAVFVCPPAKVDARAYPGWHVVEIGTCPHPVAGPIVCYCRKPQVGLIMKAIEERKLDPRRCVVVGTSKSDETMAARMNLPYQKN